MQISEIYSFFSNYLSVEDDIFNFRMAKIYRNMNQCNPSLQYFTIMHADKYCTISEKPMIAC